MVDGFKETVAQGVVDFEGAFDDLGCEFFVFHFFDRIYRIFLFYLIFLEEIPNEQSTIYSSNEVIL